MKQQNPKQPSPDGSPRQVPVPPPGNQPAANNGQDAAAASQTGSAESPRSSTRPGTAPNGKQAQTDTAAAPKPEQDAARRGQPAQQPQIQVPEKPKLADKIELKGEMQESAFKEPPWLIDRGGSYVQLTKLMYHVTEEINGEHTLAQIAEAVSTKLDRKVSEENVKQLVTKLIALQLVLNGDGKLLGGERKETSPLAVNMKTATIPRKYLIHLVNLFKFLYWKPVLLIAILLAVAVEVWIYLFHGIGTGIHDAIYTPGLMVVTLIIIIVATGFHEFGHATALEYGGGKVSGMGAGLYIVYPAFFTDVTDNYRLSRWARVRTDLGGIYFTLIFAVGLMALYVATGQAFLLLAVFVLNLEILHNLLPFVRLDGYWTLADITGIPDFFSQIKPFLRAHLPGWIPLGEGRKLPELKTWAKWFFAIYLLVTIPLLLFLLFLMVKSIPRILATTWDAIGQQITIISTAWGMGDIFTVVAAVLQTILLALPSLGLGYTLFSLGKRAYVSLMNWSRGSPPKRAVAFVGMAAAVIGIALLWLPQIPVVNQPGLAYSFVSFEPIQQNERFSLPDVVNNVVVINTPTITPTPNPLTGTPTVTGTTTPGTVTPTPGTTTPTPGTTTPTPGTGTPTPGTGTPTPGTATPTVIFSATPTILATGTALPTATDVAATSAPTIPPTNVPPTSAPTSEPTAVPPTTAPTAAPTQVPTNAPTQAPTQEPTAIPTVIFTEEPPVPPTPAQIATP